MTLSDSARDVRARTHIGDKPPIKRSAGPGRPSLRVVPAPTHIPESPANTAHGHAASDHLLDAVEAVETHPVAATHPPTVADAAGDLWLDPDDARHGLPGQLVAAGVGLAQVAGLAACWGVAHIFFATKTRTALFLLCLIAALTVWAVANHL